MLTYIILLIVAFAAITVLAPLLSLLLMVPLSPLRRFRSLRAPLLFTLAALSMFAAMLAFGWLAARLGRSPSVWFYLIPFLPLLGNDLMRVARAHTGQTPIKQMMDASGDVYDPAAIGVGELGSTLGDSVGFWSAFLISKGVVGQALPTLLFFLGLLALWAFNYSRGNPTFWHVAANHADEFFDWIRKEEAWFVLDPELGLPSIPEPRGEWVGPLLLWIPKLGHRKIQFYGRADLIEESQTRFLDSLGPDR